MSCKAGLPNSQAPYASTSPELRDRYGVVSLEIFGSYLRGEE